MNRTANDDMEYRATIGLEVHVQLATATKMFCSCANRYGAPPNSLTCPVCLGLPGALPAINEQAVRVGLLTALALGCTVAPVSSFERKNYFYPDLPKNYQITQFATPLAAGGAVRIVRDGAETVVRINRLHLEEDAGKLIHAEDEDATLVDLNRAGVPLMEIVTEPDLATPEQAHAYLTALKQIVRYVGASECDMEKGQLRCDANVSVRPKGQRALGVKVEIKNLNSFRNVQRALAHEVERQTETLRGGGTVRPETRLYDVETDATALMRTKEGADDYRYFPEPDLGPLALREGWLEAARGALPEMPAARKERFVRALGLSDYAAGVLTAERETADYLEACVAAGADAEAAGNWVMGEVLREARARKTGLAGLGLPPERLAGLLALIRDGKINAGTAKDVLAGMLESGATAEAIVAEQGLAQVSDASAIEEAVRKAVADNPKAAADFHGGKKTAVSFLMGQVMRAMKGRANPRVVVPLLEKVLRERGDV